MAYASLDEWLDETENFATRRERLLDGSRFLEPPSLMEWLETAWSLGKECGVRHGRMQTRINGCVCTFDENGNGPIDVCFAHKEWAGSVNEQDARDGLIREVKALRQRDDKLTGALKEMLAAMSVASCIDTVRAEYDFAPAIAIVRKALEEPAVNPRDADRDSEDACGLIRARLAKHNVPTAAFIDDHVANAIHQRDILAKALNDCMEAAGSDCEHEACKGVIETARAALSKAYSLPSGVDLRAVGDAASRSKEGS